MCRSGVCEGPDPDLLALALRDVGPGQSSLRKGEAGNPATLVRVHIGLSAQAYRTATGAGTLGLDTTTVSPWIEASAQ
jgi:hypothetical protein